jgi:hypothetical protein
MTNLTIHFKEQLEKAKPCDGDYLQGESIDNLVIDRMQQYDNNLDFLLGMDMLQAKQEHANTIRASIEHKIKEYELHKGEKTVFFMIEIPEGFTVLKAWESELSTLHETHDFVRMGFNAIPYLKQKS